MRRSSLGPTVDQMPISPRARPNGYWTESMMDMEQVIGAYATLLIVDEFGGHALDIPKSVANASDLVAVIGEDAARKFLRVYGGERLYVPLAPEAVKWAKGADILTQVKRGDISVGVAARRMRMKRTTLSAYLNDKPPRSMKAPEDPRRQFDLFSTSPDAPTRRNRHS